MDRSEVDAAELSMPIGEAIFTQRSIRRMRKTHQPQANGGDHPLERVGRARAMGVTGAVDAVRWNRDHGLGDPTSGGTGR